MHAPRAAEVPFLSYLSGMTRSVTLRQMRYFVAVARERNFRRAAEALSITQPPLSRQIAELEAALGVQLLERDTHGVCTTPAGDLALQRFVGALRGVDAALEQVAGAAGSSSSTALPRIRLGVLNWIDLRRLPSLEGSLQRDGLAAGIDLRTTNGKDGAAALRRHELDAALIGWPASMHRLRGDLVADVPLMAFVPASSPLARRQRLALKSLEALPPFFRFARSFNPPQYDAYTRAFQQHGFHPREEAPAPDALHVFTQIGAGRGCTVMPAPLAKHRYAGVEPRVLREDLRMPLVLVSTPRLPEPLREALRQGLERLVDGAPPTIPRAGR